MRVYSACGGVYVVDLRWKIIAVLLNLATRGTHLKVASEASLTAAIALLYNTADNELFLFY